MANPHIITIIGSINTDLVTLTPRVPSAGETLISSSFATGSGGKGANQAVACARLSRDSASAPINDISVRMIGAVGDDTFGHDLRTDLKSNGIDTDGVSVLEGERSGVAVIIVEEGTGENRILMSPNTNFCLRPENFQTLPMPLPELLVLQLEIPLDTTLRILKAAKEKSVEVLMNPAPAQKLPMEAWEAVTHLIVNESEASIITDSTDQEPSWLQWGQHTERIIALGIRHVTVTLGAQGVLYLDTRLKKFWIYEAKKVSVVDTTAAGDTFVGAYAVGIIRQRNRQGNVAQAVKWANAAAAKTVEKRGAQSAVPWGEDVERFDGDVWEDGMGFDRWFQR